MLFKPVLVQAWDLLSILTQLATETGTNSPFAMGGIFNSNELKMILHPSQLSRMGLLIMNKCMADT